MKKSFDEKERKLVSEKAADTERLSSLKEQLKTDEDRHTSQMVS